MSGHLAWLLFIDLQQKLQTGPTVALHAAVSIQLQVEVWGPRQSASKESKGEKNVSKWLLTVFIFQFHLFPKEFITRGQETSGDLGRSFQMFQTTVRLRSLMICFPDRARVVHYARSPPPHPSARFHSGSLGSVCELTCCSPWRCSCSSARWAASGWWQTPPGSPRAPPAGPGPSRSCRGKASTSWSWNLDEGAEPRSSGLAIACFLACWSTAIWIQMSLPLSPLLQMLRLSF